jgi:hypothetical protein
MKDLDTNKGVQAFAYEKSVKMSAFQPINIKPVLGRTYVLNGEKNINFKVYQDAYDDSPTNQSIINAFVNYVYGEGLFNAGTISKIDIKQFISKKDVKLICKDYKIYGGYSVQIIWNSDESNKRPLKIQYIPIYKLGVNYDERDMEINGYWYCYDWNKMYRYRPVLYPKFQGEYIGNDLEILVVKRAHAEPFFPVPDYLSGIPWAQVEGELANAGKNHFKNSLGTITVINYNGGKMATPELAKEEANKVRKQVGGTDNEGAIMVSFNEDAEFATTVDRVAPPELNQQNVFYSEEAERKLIVAHSAPPILFSGSNAGSGFSSNADEIETATNSLYRRHINPMREVIVDGLMEVFLLIDSTIKLDFKDFEAEELEGTEEAAAEPAKPVNKFKKLFGI